MKIKGLNNRVLIKPLVETVTKGGIIIPGKKDEKPDKGIVINTCREAGLDKNDIVMYNKYTAVPLKDSEGNEYVLVKHEDLYAKLGEDGKEY